MEREERHLEGDPHGEKREGHERGPDPLGGRQPGRHVRHVQSPGHLVHETDADEDERGPDRAHHEVLEGRGQRLPAAPEGDERVGGERRDLEEDEDVEQVPGDRDAEQPRETEQIQRAEEVVAARRDLVRQAARRIGENERGDAGHEEEDEGAERVDPVLDSPGRGPAPHSVADGAALEHIAEEGHGDEEGEPAHADREREHQRAPPQNDAQRRRQKRDDDLEDGQLGLEHQASSCA